MVIDQLPEPSALAVPTRPSSSDVNSTWIPASEVPDSVGVVSLVRSSVSAVPESLADDRSGTLGTFGATVSIVSARADDGSLTPDTPSSAVAVMS